MSALEPGISDELDGKARCAARSPGGWWCCLPGGHDLNHIGTTQGWGTLYQWEPDDPPEVDPEDAEAQRIAETCADAADEYRAIEAGEW